MGGASYRAGLTMEIRRLFDQCATAYDQDRPQLVPDFDEFYGAALRRIPFAEDARLTVLDLGADARLELGDGVVIEGHIASPHVRIDDETVSRHHAEVRARGGELEIEDLGSTNGTLVNGERIARPQRLQPGDRVHIASLQLVVRA